MITDMMLNTMTEEELALRIARTNGIDGSDKYVGVGGTMLSNIADAVLAGIRLGRRIERRNQGKADAE
jgi:hypothetical protein